MGSVGVGVRLCSGVQCMCRAREQGSQVHLRREQVHPHDGHYEAARHESREAARGHVISRGPEHHVWQRGGKQRTDEDPRPAVFEPAAQLEGDECGGARWHHKI